MTDLDEEAKRLAAAHPWASTGAAETHRTAWQPQHAVPRRPAPYRPTDETIELQVAADLARIDRELDPQAQPPVFGSLLRLAGDAGVGADYFAAHDAMLDLAARMRNAHARSRLYSTDPDPLNGGWADDDVGRLDANQWRAISRHTEKMARLVVSCSNGAPSWVGYDLAAPAPPKQRKPKTYVAPGRKAGRTWITRLEQSKQAKGKPR